MSSLVWWVDQGNGGADLLFGPLFKSQSDAKGFARQQFPNEDPETRDGRIYYREVVSFKESVQ
jgi:hypothetical protein